MYDTFSLHAFRQLTFLSVCITENCVDLDLNSETFKKECSTSYIWSPTPKIPYPPNRPYSISAFILIIAVISKFTYCKKFSVVHFAVTTVTVNIIPFQPFVNFYVYTKILFKKTTWKLSLSNLNVFIFVRAECMSLSPNSVKPTFLHLFF